jgi:hypothetical protein
MRCVPEMALLLVEVMTSPEKWGAIGSALLHLGETFGCSLKRLFAHSRMSACQASW